MKRIIIIVISLFIMPILVNAETLTYNVCDTCEYSDINYAADAINSISDLSDKDIVINVNGDSTYSASLDVGNDNNSIKSVVVNGNNHNYNDVGLSIYSKEVTVNNFDMIRTVFTADASKVLINNVKVRHEIAVIIAYPANIKIINSTAQILMVAVGSDNSGSSEVKLDEILELDNYSLSNIKDIQIVGYLSINNMDFSKNILILSGDIDIKGGKVNKIIGFRATDVTNINIYNSKFNSLKYTNITSSEREAMNEYYRYIQTLDSTALMYDIYDFDATGFGVQQITTTKVYFDKDTEIKVNDKINLVDYLDYYTEDKEISYTIEDQSIAKIENKELIGLKPGNTKVQVTTDDGHVIYNINLTVFKIEEKNINMRAETKLKLNSVFKDLDLSSVNDNVWEISNPKVAKVVNGEIISLSKGTTDITGIVNGVKYIYHLTVSDTPVSKEIKVPITGKSIKLWIVIVTAILLSVICICTYMLIKKRK